MAVCATACKTCNKRGGRVVLECIGIVDLGKINNVLWVSFGMKSNDAIVVLCCHSDDVTVDCAGQNTSVVMVGVVSGNLTSAGNGEDCNITVVAIFCREGVYCLDKPLSLRDSISIQAVVFCKCTLLEKCLEIGCFHIFCPL